MGFSTDAAAAAAAADDDDVVENECSYFKTLWEFIDQVSDCNFSKETNIHANFLCVVLCIKVSYTISIISDVSHNLTV